MRAVGDSHSGLVQKSRAVLMQKLATAQGFSGELYKELKYTIWLV